MDSWLSAIWRASWQGAVAISVVWLLCRLVKGIDPRVQAWLWRLVYVRLIVSLISLPAVNLPLLPQSTTLIISSPENDGLLADAAGKAITVQPGGLSSWQLVAISLFIAWIVGLLWSIGQLLREASETRRLRSRCEPVTDSTLAAEYESLAGLLGIQNPPALLVSAEACAPLLISASRAAIAIPDSFASEYSAEQRRMILVHELAHYKRADLRWSWLARLARCVFFFHPFVWLADHEWQQSQEMACDREVLRLELDSPSSYGATLLRVVQQPGRQSLSGVGVMCVAESYSTVRRRLLAMNQSVKMSRRGIAVTGTLVLVASAVAFVPWRVVAQESSKKIAAEKAAMMSHEGITFLKPELLKELDLSAVQVAKIKSIHENALRQVRRTLTPQQAADLDKMAMIGSANKVHVSFTPEQADKLDTLKRQLGESAKAIEADSSLSPAEKEERLRALKLEHEAAFKQILTPEQQEAADKAHAIKGGGDSPQLSEDQMKQLADAKRHLAEMAQQIERDTASNPEEKKARMAELDRVKEDHLHRILTPEQLQQMAQHKAAAAGGPYSLAAISALGLSPAQQRRIETIHRDAQRQFQAVLTPAQRAKVQRLHSN